MGDTMRERAALKLAIELLHEPWRVRLVREQPLPQGMPLLLDVAAGDAASGEAAVEALGRPLGVVRQAATFFIEQVLLAPNADSYRVLGASPAATSAELRRNMAMLMRWLHPDVAGQGEQAIFAARIATAWNALKTPERRAAYDSERQSMRGTGHRTPAAASGAGSRSGASRHSMAQRRRTRGLPRILAFWLLGRPRHRQ